ncbi:TonB-dependent siderophore receptor [Gayadomonas joobiniege]|uniref:TonB-dependent siderophore receptor n=1 Tax=Gayadomonas joobiniege TaxID=1234606 RepID=UPI00037187EA|nr:TonB-dependent siderophore receptor [Gayadomonas joobiniege]
MNTRANGLPFKLSIIAATLFAYQPSLNAAESSEIERIQVQSHSSYRSTATKSSLKAIDAPTSISIIDQALLKLRQADSVTKALRYVSGVTTESRPSISIFDQFNIRGFDTYQSFYDGLPLLSNNSWNLYPQVDAFATDSVEILKGPASSLYGLVPPGGMVNQVAKYPSKSQNTKLIATTGSHNLIELGLDSTGQFADSGEYRIIALGRSRDGQQDTTENERYLFAPSATIHFSEQTNLTISAYYQNDPEMVPSTPLHSIGTLYQAPYGALDADAYAGDKNWNHYEREVFMWGYKFNHQFDNGWTFLQKARFTDADALQQNMYNKGLADDNVTLIRSAYSTDEQIRGLTLDNQLAGTYSFANSQHAWLLGLDYQTSESDVAYRDTLGQNTASIDLSNRDNNMLVVSELPLDFYQEDHQIDIKQLGIYFQDEINWQQLTFILNGRWDSFESTDIADNVYAGSEYGSTTQIEQNAFSGRLAALYRFSNGWRAYANYAESFEPQSGSDTETGLAFEPTTGQQTEVGAKYQSDNGQNRLNAAYFVLKKDNLVTTGQAVDPNTNETRSMSVQTGQVEAKGVELEFNSQLNKDVSLSGNLTWLDMEVTADLDQNLVGKTPVWVADFMASFWANYHFTESFPGLMLGAGYRYVGETQMDKYNTDTVSDYGLLDLVAAYQFTQNDVKLTASVSNLTDERYVGACYDASNCWMGSERMVEVGVEFNF